MGRKSNDSLTRGSRDEDRVPSVIEPLQPLGLPHLQSRGFFGRVLGLRREKSRIVGCSGAQSHMP